MLSNVIKCNQNITCGDIMGNLITKHNYIVLNPIACFDVKVFYTKKYVFDTVHQLTLHKRYTAQCHTSMK